MACGQDGKPGVGSIFQLKLSSYQRGDGFARLPCWTWGTKRTLIIPPSLLPLASRVSPGLHGYGSSVPHASSYNFTSSPVFSCSHPDFYLGAVGGGRGECDKMDRDPLYLPPWLLWASTGGLGKQCAQLSDHHLYDLGSCASIRRIQVAKSE